MHRLCVFAGSRDGARPEYLASARELGAAVARRGWGLVYGGASVGTMGALADAALGAGGEVLGVIPRAMVERELAHTRVTQLVVVESMHERKATMHQWANAFVALPGGFGTLDETFEAITWAQLGLHDKPVAFLDVAGYWGALAQWIDRAARDGFVPREHARAVRIESDVGTLLDHLAPR
jgi:uncharacterized protein (TIGR00730 family)